VAAKVGYWKTIWYDSRVLIGVIRVLDIRVCEFDLESPPFLIGFVGFTGSTAFGRVPPDSNLLGVSPGSEYP